MKVFYSDRHEMHSPAWYVADGTVRPLPEVRGRVERILEAIRAVGGMEMEVAREGTGAEEEAFWRAVRGVHEEGYLEYLRTIYAVWVAEFGKCDVIPDTFVRPLGKRAVRRPRKASAQAGYYCFDMAAPITEGTWVAVVASARCAVRAAEVVLGGDGAAYALCRPPGHHAGADYCGGFCYLNNVAIAAQRMLDGDGEGVGRGGRKRVAILDMDYHHGNGTQDIFYARDDVMFVSLHAEPDTQYPYFWGYAEERGEGAGEGFNLNLPMRRGASEGEWLAVLDRAIAAVGQCGAEALLVSLGADVYEADGVGDFGVTMEGFGEVGRRVRSLGLPTVFVQEGGYNVEKVGECVGRVLSGFNAG